ncbi:MAG: hypothetical protein A2508_02040 [Candidatus Lambdaproteobacteria bacterium RIFOXYD12_FULL_49_8]|uniref:Uncharacterized protein n=1 Tax=Candidatus Lambdaproteobacteria bacterium RIFOXYD2_FULL_50_16 TaxID=1817772 RepID=A0A1F6G6B8_9PROT|nr:MAG: hypothetical protein A2527_11045 [Candidatus Lambdaproteobacteria bacterium RIFOXYD2_FULL_50_16]OGG98027.1 MAG: hypothetical protein A2508_02040 [Candidatus Lambdaproteobacteria bacterium RIFOXYD12_FULL_49_8]
MQIGPELGTIEKFDRRRGELGASHQGQEGNWLVPKFLILDQVPLKEKVAEYNHFISACYFDFLVT